MLDSRFWILDGCDGSFVNLVKLDNLVKWLIVHYLNGYLVIDSIRGRKAGSSILTIHFTNDYSYSLTAYYTTFIVKNQMKSKKLSIRGPRL